MPSILPELALKLAARAMTDTLGPEEPALSFLVLAYLQVYIRICNSLATRRQDECHRITGLDMTNIITKI